MFRAKFLRWGHRLIERGAWYFAPLSWVYAFVVVSRNRLYDWGFIKVFRAKAVVVSVGNIVAGGTGKTPFVLMLAKALQNRKVAILSRGYGEMPDEAMLLARRLPDVRVYIGKDRAELAKTADAEVLILDDGFQHRRLFRDFDIVLVRKKKEHYLPWGFLRDEPRRLTGAEVIHVENLHLKVGRILDLAGNSVESIRGWKVGIFCGIAHPENFRQTVLDLGSEIVFEKFLGDHEKVDLNELPFAPVWICTEKDVVKLGKTDLPIYFLEMEMEVIGARDRWQKLVERINQKIDNKQHL